MVWSTNSPDGTISVKANQIPMLANTAYIKTTMNVDHFWDVGVNQDGRHKQVQMPKTVGDVTLGAGMDGAMYLRAVSASNLRFQGFYRNGQGIYQYIPTFQTGSVAISGSYATVASIENDSYGHIYMWVNDNKDNGQMGFFKATSNVLHAYNFTTQFSGSSTASANLKFGNGTEASGLDIRARKQDGPSGTYQYRIIYWGM